MKYNAIFLFIACMFLTFFSEKTQSQTLKNKFGIRLFGIYEKISTGDINKIINSYNDAYAKLNKNPHNQGKNSYKGKLTKLGWDTGLGLEISTNINKSIRIGISSALLTFTQNSTVTTSDYSFAFESDYDDTYNFDNEIKMIPVQISIYYHHSINSIINGYISMGTGYYFAEYKNVTKDKREYKRYSSITEDEYTLKAKDNTIGFQGGIGIEINIISNLFLVIESNYLYCNLRDLKAEGTHRNFSGDLISAGSGRLWYYEENTWYSEKDFLISKERPNLSPPFEPETLRKAEINLSGPSFKIGIRLIIF